MELELVPAAAPRTWRPFEEFAGRNQPRRPTPWAITDGEFTLAKALVLGKPVYTLFRNDRLMREPPAFDSSAAAHAWLAANAHSLPKPTPDASA